MGKNKETIQLRLRERDAAREEAREQRKLRLNLIRSLSDSVTAAGRERDEAVRKAAAEKQTRLNLAGALVDARRALVAARRARDTAVGKATAEKIALLGEARAKIERLEADLAEKERTIDSLEAQASLAKGRVRELESKPTQVVIQAPCGAEVTVERVHRNFAQGGVI